MTESDEINIENLKLGCCNFEQRRFIYKLLAGIYLNRNSITQRHLLYIAEDVFNIQLTEPTLRKYIKLARKYLSQKSDVI